MGEHNKAVILVVGRVIAPAIIGADFTKGKVSCWWIKPVRAVEHTAQREKACWRRMVTLALINSDPTTADNAAGDLIVRYQTVRWPYLNIHT